MVLRPWCGAAHRRPTHPRLRSTHPRLRSGDDAGAQALEFALVLPALVLVLSVVIHLAALGADLLRAQHLARDEARAAVLGTATPRAADREVRVIGPDRDGIVVATVRVRNRLLSRYVGDVWVTGRATMVAEP